MRPRIGVTCAFNFSEDWFYVRQGYIKAVFMAGGFPVILPSVQKVALINAYLEMLDGLLLTGGGDIDPFFLGETPDPALREINPERDWFEIELTRQALVNDIPILGICRGIQVINIAAGGSIYQNIDTHYSKLIMHEQKAPRDFPIHSVEVVSDSRLARILNLDLRREKENNVKLCIRVNSFHHQAIKEVAPGFIVSAWAPDGVIEAIESIKKSLVLGVQWHPEYLWIKDGRFLGLFRALVEVAHTRANSRRNRKEQEIVKSGCRGEGPNHERRSL